MYLIIYKQIHFIILLHRRKVNLQTPVPTLTAAKYEEHFCNVFCATDQVVVH